jgi:hypothetical protein
MPPRKRAAAAPAAAAAVPAPEVRAPRTESWGEGLTDEQAEKATEEFDLSTEEGRKLAARRERAKAQRPVGNDVCCTLWR